MVTGTPKRVPVESNTDLLRVLEDVSEDKLPRLVERDGHDLAVVVSIEDYMRSLAIPTSRRMKETLLGLAGAWSHLDADALMAYVDEGRQSAPPSEARDL